MKEFEKISLNINEAFDRKGRIEERVVTRATVLHGLHDTI